MGKMRVWILMGLCGLSIAASLAYFKKRSPEIKKSHARQIPIDSLAAILQDGDIVLRAGNDMTSNMLRQLNLRDQRFSHCGLVFKSADTCWVYHSIGSESDPNQAIKKERLEQFYAPQNNIAIGYAGMQLSAAEQQRLQMVLDSFYQKKIPFDMQFDLHTDDKLYCSEMVAKALLLSVPQIGLKATDTLGKQYWSIDNLSHNDRVRMIQYLPYE
ncbi:hypothetical protein DBR32_10880 [Taibaiella sp. KBW10]|uniref:YiiX/YebB-like N1pC/P60 family cysteine hydrolase n=1 Tax=Taibaiella sp. KBW10 TaxID=2153357 RepID=UPI000F5A9FDC|nr:YiiX/YebB-like N1pC/P60 family cysteine hydrolase [Taibaiella sp. KBW10]RQO30083.1 hypothetical protein DBR32_10880 [Taibaiella sp. KBW10]